MMGLVRKFLVPSIFHLEPRTYHVKAPFVGWHGLEKMQNPMLLFIYLDGTWADEVDKMADVERLEA